MPLAPGSAVKLAATYRTRKNGKPKMKGAKPPKMSKGVTIRPNSPRQSTFGAAGGMR